MKAADGDRKGGQECGIRICNEKYMCLNTGSDSNCKYAVLSRQGGGGACVAVTEKAVIIGVYGKTTEMSNKKLQNTGDCQKNVFSVAKQLKELGF